MCRRAVRPTLCGNAAADAAAPEEWIMSAADSVANAGSALNTGMRPEDEVDTSNLVSQVASSGNLDLARQFVGAFPEQRNALDGALMGNRNFSFVHQLAADSRQVQSPQVPAQRKIAQADATAQTQAQPQARLMPERQVTAFQSTNAREIAADQAAIGRLGTAQQALDAARQTDLTLASKNKVPAIESTLKAANTFLAEDARLRRTAADTIRDSTYPKGELGKDPAVVDAIRAVQAHARTRPASATADGLDRVDQRVAGLKRADVPEWVRYNSLGGPRYPPNPERMIGTSPAWQNLIAAGTATDSVQRVVSRIADNEGSLDAVQAYDNQIASLGAMQKTIDPAGHGELAKQVYEFSQTNPGAYQRLFASQGWTAAHTGTGTTPGDYTMSYTNPNDPNAQPLTGPALDTYIRQRNDPARWQETLGPLFRAGRDAEFQQKQIGDFVTRLDDALEKVPRGAYTQPISSYLTSEQAASLVLDQDVNRPGYVATDMGRALDTFYAANPKVSRDPSQWTAQERATYEPQIVAAYTSVRRMTDADTRAQHITGPGTTLSALPGSLVRATPPLTTNTP